MEQHYRKIVRDTEKRVIAAMRRQITEPADARFGGFRDGTGIVQAKYAIYQAAPMTAAYCCPDTMFYRSAEVYDRILAGLAYIRSVQHENGLFDYITCNFFSAPDTAFCLKKLLPVYEYLRRKAGKAEDSAGMDGEICKEKAAKAGGGDCGEQRTAGNGGEDNGKKTAGSGKEAAGREKTDRGGREADGKGEINYREEKIPAAEEITAEEREILRRLEEIIKDGANGMLAGGFHTPNHRWAIASVLMACSRFFGSMEMEEAAYGYLKEGIDCNADGEYSEKSAGNYNRINNDAMLLLSQVTGDASYEQHALRNLKMMLAYIEPDGSIHTANSTRFDKDLLVYPTDYYMEYLRMGMKYHIPEFLQMCNSIFDIAEEKRVAAPDCLIWFLLCPDYRTFEYGERYPFGDYHIFYGESGIARCRNGRYTYTVMKGKSDFFYLHNGTMKVAAKVCGSFCEHRAFQSGEMEQLSEGEYHLRQVMRGWYYLPFEKAPETSDWWRMDHAARPKKSGPDMQIDVWVKETEDGVDIRVKASGVEGAPWRIELAFSGVNFLTSPLFDMPVSGSEILVVKEGEIEAENDRDTLVIGPCFGEHHFTEGKDGSEKKAPGAFTLYLTDYTAFDREIRIRNKLSSMIRSGRPDRF